MADSTLAGPAAGGAGAAMRLSRVQHFCLFSCVMATAIGQSLVFAVLPPLGREVRLAELQITSIIAISALIFAAASPHWGRYSDRVGRKPVILIGLAGYTAGTLAFAGLFQAALLGLLGGSLLFALLLACRVLQAMVMSASGPAATAYAADHSGPERRARAMARLGAAHSAGAMLGPAVGGALASFGLLAPLVFAGCLSAAAALHIRWRLPATPPRRQPGEQRGHARVRYSDRRVARLLAIAAGMFCGFASIQQTLGFTIQDRMGLDGIRTAQLTGAALMVSAAFSIAAQMLLVRKLDWRPETFIRLAVASQLASAIVIGLSGSFAGICVGMALMGAGLGMAMPSILAAASLAVGPREQGGVAGLVASCPALGFVLGPVFAGYLYQRNPDYSGAFSLCIFAALLAALLATGGRRGERAGAGGGRASG